MLGLGMGHLWEFQVGEWSASSFRGSRWPPKLDFGPQNWISGVQNLILWFQIEIFERVPPKNATLVQQL